jgi:hypothetical protein
MSQRRRDGGPRDVEVYRNTQMRLAARYSWGVASARFPPT